MAKFYRYIMIARRGSPLIRKIVGLSTAVCVFIKSGWYLFAIELIRAMEKVKVILCNMQEFMMNNHDSEYYKSSSIIGKHLHELTC